MITRRQFVKAVGAVGAAGVVGVGFPRRAWGVVGAETFHEWKEVAPGIFAVLGRTADNMELIGGNSVLITDPAGAVLIDSKQAVLAPALKAEAAGKAKVTKLVNTHHHFDHAGGNAAFSPGCPVVAHAACAARLKGVHESYLAQFEQKAASMEKCGAPGAADAAAAARAWFAGVSSLAPNAFEPTETHTGDFKIEVGVRECRVKHFGIGHTDNDLVVHLPRENVVITGDLIFNGLNPYYDASARADSAGWISSLRQVEKLCDAKTIVVPGHGPVGDVTSVKTQIEYFELVRAAVAKAIKEGRSRDEVSKMSLPGREALGLKAALPYLWGGVFDELSKPTKPESKPAPKPAGS